MNSLDELARIRGQIHAPTPAPAPATVNMVEVQMMIDMAIREARIVMGDHRPALLSLQCRAFCPYLRF